MKRALLVLSVVLVSMLIAGTAFPQSKIGFMGVGGKLGMVDPEGIDTVIGFGAVVDLGTITPDIMLEGGLDFWSKSEGESGAEASFRDIILGGAVKYMIKTSNPKFKPFAGGGLGLHLAKAEVEFTNPVTGQKTSTDDSETKFGIHLLGGLFYNVSPSVDILGELRYALVSDMNQLSIMGGAVFKLGK